MSALDLAAYRQTFDALRPLEPQGVVTRAVGLAVEVAGVTGRIGDFCVITPRGHGEPLMAEVVGFRDADLLLMPLGELTGVEPGSHVALAPHAQMIPCGHGLLGRVVDALGRPLDNRGPFHGVQHAPMRATPPSAFDRPRISDPLATGVKAIDGVLTCGVGQRIGIFAGSGVGKSTLLGMIARGASADVNVIGLVGERGREVQDFLQKQLGPEGLRRSVVVVATSDQPALLRLKAAWMATAIAEEFRAAGKHVLLLLDSVTRVAMAQREIGLASDEPPALRGYTPSVFATLPRLLERSGMSASGAITAFYTVLVEGDDMNEPVADTVRGVLDGHIVLSRQLAAENIYPSIDILRSVSRVMSDVVTPAHQAAANRLRDVLANYERHRDLITIGAYVPGSSPQVDAALALHPVIQQFRRQDQDHLMPFAQTIADLDAATRG